MSVMSPRKSATSRLRPQYQDLLYRFVFQGLLQVLVFAGLYGFLVLQFWVLVLFHDNQEV